MDRMTHAAGPILVTEDEYLEHELRSEAKHELLHGVIVAMAGASREHNAIAGNIVAALGALLKGRRCLVFPSDQRVHVEATGLFTYPDVTVACDELRFHPKNRDTLLNPRVIASVLSDSTEAYDRGAKFAHYRSIPSLLEYVLVSQDEHRIEHYRRLESGQWVLTVYEGDAAAAELPALGCTLSLAAVYDKLDLLAAG
jgi:Uma2 family endonuclease